MITLDETIKEHLAGTLSAKRVDHILRVAREAERLARLHGVDPVRARLAGLLHDLAREIPGPRLLEECRLRGVAIMPIDEVNPVPRLHGRLGACWARERFGIEDEDVLEAIASHTLGRVGMTPLDMVVFLADYAEPGRPSFDVLERVRDLAPHDLEEATRLAMDGTMRYLLDTRRSLHPQVVDARNWILTRAEAPNREGNP
jgi:predicted HD superfamily hydrolase involved in NAD metabolism